MASSQTARTSLRLAWTSVWPPRRVLTVETERNVHSSQKDFKKGFGGQFGKAEVTDKSAHGFDEPVKPVGSTYERPKIAGELVPCAVR